MLFQKVLDCKDITLHKVTDEKTGQDLEFCLGSSVDPYGSKLEITLPSTAEKRSDIKHLQHDPVLLTWRKSLIVIKYILNVLKSWQELNLNLRLQTSVYETMPCSVFPTTT